MDAPNKVVSISDCTAMVTKLTNLWGKIYPAASSEREPSPRYETCLNLHYLFTQMRQLPFRAQQSSVLLMAWFQYEFPASALFCDHLQADLHADTDASRLKCDQYLADMYKHLHNAQDMYVRVNKPVTRAAVPAAKRERALVMNQPVKKQQTPKKSNNASASTGKRGRGDQTPRRSDSGSQAAPRPPGGGRTDDQNKTLKKAREIRAPNGVRLCDLAQAAGVSRSHQDCLRLYDTKACVVCGINATHKGTLQCPSMGQGCASAVQAVQDRRKQYLDLAWAEGVDAAVMSFK